MITESRLYKTNDGGLTWIEPHQPLHSDSEGHFTSIKFFKDGRYGWISGGIYTPISDDEDYIPNRYLSTDEQVLRGIIFYTEDGGENWHRQLVTQHWGHLTVLFATDAEHAWAAGTAGGFYFSNGKWNTMKQERTESGKIAVNSLAVVIGYPTLEPAGVFFLNSSLGWLSNSNGYLAASQDGGNTWQDIYPTNIQDNPPDDFIRLFFIDQMNGWACGHEGGLYTTTDGGLSWERQKSDTSFFDFSFLESGEGWAISKEGLFRLK